jgi:DNA-binding CsgD family transcriptional regulator
MSASRIDLLTEAQRACLRLVLTHHNSKEIAALLGVSPSAIDKRIERAVQVLGAGSRFEAARLLQRHETAGDFDVPAEPRVMPSATPAPRAANDRTEDGTSPMPSSDLLVATYDRLPSEPIDVARAPSHPPQVGQDDPWGLVRRFIGMTPRGGPEGAARNRLSKGDRLIRLVGLMALLAITTVALVTMTMTMTSLFRQVRGSAASPRVEHSSRWGGKFDMLKERRQATDRVTADFLKAEAAVDQAASLAASCVATLLQQRAAAKLPVATGIAALQLVADASSDLIKARQRFVDAHHALVAVRSEIGLGAFYAYGDEGECPPNEGALRDDARLHLVVAA